MEKYVNPELEVLAAAAADVISSSVSYDENEVKEDGFFSVWFILSEKPEHKTQKITER